MKNFPQSFEPVGSDSILEQFIQLKNYVNDVLSMFEDNVNEILDSNDFVQTKVQNLTNEQKEQARENIGAGASTINVVDNLDSTSIIDALSANQGHVLQGLFAQLNTKVEENTDTIDEHTTNISSLNQQSARALKTPIVSPTATELVAIDDNNSQVGVSLGTGLKLENGTLKAGENYSSIEQFTGNYWIDGKPIYRKCNIITIPNSVNNWNYIWTLSSRNLTLLKVYSNLYHLSYEQYPNKIELYSNGKEIFESHASDYFNGNQLYLVVEYIYND